MNHSHQYDPYTFPSEEVEIQLDILNKTSTQINELEKRLEISYDTYRRVLSDHSNKLLELSKKLGKCVSRTRLYNEFRQKQACRRKEIQLAALKYDNAISALNVARDKLAKLESCVLEPGVSDPDTLESLNQSITDFNDANKLLNNAKLEHEKLMEIYAANEQSIHQFEKRHRFDINKAKPYYTMYDHFMLEMEAAKTHVELCTNQLKACKSIYAMTMSTLENLSNSMHIMRLNQCNPDDNHLTSSLGHDIQYDLTTKYHVSNVHSNCDDDDDDGDDHVNNSTTTELLSSPNASLQFVVDNQVEQKNRSFNSSEHQLIDVNNNLTMHHFPMMNGLLKSVQQATIEIDSFQNSPFLSPIKAEGESSHVTAVLCPNTTTTFTISNTNASNSTTSTTTATTTASTTTTASSSCTENNSFSESLSVSSCTSSASISPALSFDTFTTSLDEQHSSSTLMLINSFNNLNITASVQHHIHY
uniref:SH3 domain-binding protein n=1 Tax=Schistosoma japonicum TaxID=6182 RepID=C7TZ88_SCHJA|nr:SH3 domain-binding protein [Schistosoma japonicum]